MLSLHLRFQLPGVGLEDRAAAAHSNVPQRHGDMLGVRHKRQTSVLWIN